MEEVLVEGKTQINTEDIHRITQVCETIEQKCTRCGRCLGLLSYLIQEHIAYLTINEKKDDIMSKFKLSGCCLLHIRTPIISNCRMGRKMEIQNVNLMVPVE